MIKVFIADDHPIVRAGLRQLIDYSDDISVIGEAEDGTQVIKSVNELEPDVVLLDISMPGMNGLDILKQLTPTRPDLPVLILSMHSEDQYAIRVLKAGAAGYLTKTRTPDELVNAIRTVAAGKKYISSSIAERLAQGLGSGFDHALHEALSDREMQVLQKIAQGHTVTEIAEQLILSVKTISTYRSRILEKLNLRTNAELTYYAIKNEIVE